MAKKPSADNAGILNNQTRTSPANVRGKQNKQQVIPAQRLRAGRYVAC